MSDWKFGDVLEHNSHPHATRVLFVGRPGGPPRYENGVLVFWGFTGIYLQPDCPETGPDPGPIRPCGNDHFLGHLGSFGGNPDDPKRGDAWTVVDNVMTEPAGASIWIDGEKLSNEVVFAGIDIAGGGSTTVLGIRDASGTFTLTDVKFTKP